MSIANQLRASDFVILTGTSEKGAYKFAKIDNRCALMNNPVFLAELEQEGAKVVAIAKK
jgi:hypothetical protein